MYVFFFFKQKTAYEMRISDWSSDVCSSDLEQADLTAECEELAKLVESPARQKTRLRKDLEKLRDVYGLDTLLGARRTTIAEAAPARDIPLEIGRASCRERVCQYV